MRLWHTDLISVLPRQQLLSQWRELCSIYAKQDNHILINFVYKDISSFKKYSDLVIIEFSRRGYIIREQSMSKYRDYFSDKDLVDVSEIFPEKMNMRYFKQCYYNLEEKFDCGGITIDEFEPTYCLAKEKMGQNRQNE